jgi:undecaprenyl-diphosphatase
VHILEAIVLGIIQGLTEFLPVSSSGHIELGKAILGVQIEEDLLFTVVLHAATALSTLVVFRRQILQLFTQSLKREGKDQRMYSMLLVWSMIPVGIVGLLWEDSIEVLFNGNVLLVGCMLLITGVLLYFSSQAAAREGTLSFGNVFWIGVSQAIAILPGISRSGATICTGLLLGIRRETVAQFSFLMVLAPIFGASLLKLKAYLALPAQSGGLSLEAMAAGFLAAFVTGIFACTWMINLVKRGKLVLFAYYCFGVGLLSILWSLL